MTTVSSNIPSGPERLRQDLANMASGMRHIGSTLGGWVLYEFVNRCGEAHREQPLPTQYRRGAPKACFHNTRQLVRRHKRLTYAEGYVAIPRIPLPIHHAWAIDENARVIDVTFNNPESCHYLGVRFTPDEVVRYTQPSSFSLFLNMWEMINIQIIRDRCPEILTLT